MRDLVVLAIVALSIPVTIVRPFAGLAVYSWLAYMRPQDMAWGASRTLPLSAAVAAATVAGLVLAWRRERPLTWRPQTVLLLALCGWIALSTWTAVLPEAAKDTFGHYWKGIAIAVLTTGLVRDRARLRAMLLLIPFCLGLVGAQWAVHGLAMGGTRYDDGPGGFLSDNNSFALALNMMIPLLAAVAITERRNRPLRLVAAACAALCAVTVFFTYSRGGALTLALVAVLLVARSRRRFTVAAVLAGGLLVAVALSSDKVISAWVDRASTISDYQEDGSAQGRINSWITSWRVFLDYPVLGVGPNNLETVYNRYAPNNATFHVAHNAYLQILSESGAPALLLFLALLATTLLRLERTRRRHRGSEYETWAGMLQISLLAYMAGSMFLNMGYLELMYHLCGVSVALEVVAAQEQPADARREAAADLPWWKRPPEPLPAPALAGREA